jgi:circadian clock protein KaiC
MEVFPRLVPEHTDRVFNPELLSTGVDELDLLLGGGLERGTVTLVSGQAGIGKSTIAAQLMSAIGQHDGTALGYLFEETVDQFSYRADRLDMLVADHDSREDLWLREVEPLVISAEEFGQQVIDKADEHEPDLVVIDGIGGYKVAMQGDEQRLVTRIHALTRVLKNRGISVILTDEVDELTRVSSVTSTRTSYLADNIILLTYREHDRELLRAISIVKKRLGPFEPRFRRFEIRDGEGLAISDDLPSVGGVLQQSALIRQPKEE